MPRILFSSNFLCIILGTLLYLQTDRYDTRIDDLFFDDLFSTIFVFGDSSMIPSDFEIKILAKLNSFF